MHLVTYSQQIIVQLSLLPIPGPHWLDTGIVVASYKVSTE